MKRLLILALISLLCGSILSPSTSAISSLDKYVLVSENDHLALYIDTTNTSIAIRDKRSDVNWFSNPENWESNELLARGKTKDKLGAQLSITYFNLRDIRLTMDNYNDSIVYDQFEIVPITNGVRVDYTLGKKWDDDSYLPVIIEQNRFEELILDNLSEQEQRLFSSSYTLVSLVEADDSTSQLDIFNLDESVFEQYTLVAVGQTQTEAQQKRLIETYVDYIVDNRSDLRSRMDVRDRDVSLALIEPAYILNRNLMNWDIEDMIQIIKDLNLEPTDVKVDYQQFGLDEPSPNEITFSVPIEYILDEDNLLVRIPVEDITYPQGFPLYMINVFEYFGAADTSSEGYIFVPDGSGALINLNNGRTEASAYRAQVYGRDRALDPTSTLEPNKEQIYLPVFGIKKHETALVGIIEQGRSIASINADIAGRIVSYNNVYPSFAVIPYGVAGLEGYAEWRAGQTDSRNEINVYQSRKTDTDIQIRYAFLYDDEANYVGMAQYYQEYLLENSRLTKIVPEADIPLLLELVGAIGVERPVLGAPREVMAPLTTYSQVQDILNRFIDTGISNLDLRYLGWMKGGLHHYYPRKVDLEKALGGKQQFQELLNYISIHDVDLYPDVNFLEIYRNTLFDRFSTSSQVSRFISREVAQIYEQNRILMTRRSKGIGYITSPRVLADLITGFADDLSGYALNGISLSRFGKSVSSDFRTSPEELVDREQSVKIMEKSLQMLKKNLELKVMVEGGNDYVLPYANIVMQAPLTSSDYFIFDETIPFYQTVVHGFVHYSGEPVNLGGNQVKNMLRVIEYGANPSYQLIFADPWVIKETSFDDLYSVSYHNWFEDVCEFYQRTNSVLQDVQSERIIDHGQIAANVYKTTYENKQAVIVNYNKESVNIDGVSLPGEDFLLLEGDIAHE